MQLSLARHFVEVGERRRAKSGGMEPTNHLFNHEEICFEVFLLQERLQAAYLDGSVSFLET